MALPPSSTMGLPFRSSLKCRRGQLGLPSSESPRLRQRPTPSLPHCNRAKLSASSVFTSGTMVNLHRQQRQYVCATRIALYSLFRAARVDHDWGVRGLIPRRFLAVCYFRFGRPVQRLLPHYWRSSSHRVRKEEVPLTRERELSQGAVSAALESASSLPPVAIPASPCPRSRSAAHCTECHIP